MRRAAACWALAAAALFAAETGVDALDPAREPDRARLLRMVRDGDGDRHDAARKLAKEGHIEDLLEILRTTDVYHAMQAVTGALGERSVAVMEERLRAEPDNRYLVGALRPPTDPRVTRLLLQALDSRERRTVLSAAHGLVFAADIDGLGDALRSRFDATTSEELKLALAKGLLRRGDAAAVPWLRERLRARAWGALGALDMPPGRDRVPFADASVLAPLLPDLVDLLDDERHAPDARRVLRQLTRRDFAMASEWRAWLERVPHPVYTRQLDDALRSCAEAFHDEVHRIDRSLDVHVAPLPLDGGAWRVEGGSTKALYDGRVASGTGPTWEDGSPVRQPEFRIRLLLSIGTGPRATPECVAERRFDRIGVVASLCLGEGGARTKRSAVVEAAYDAFEALERYEPR